jgi:cobalt-precorrin-5B (C1)-methyltransferase
MAKKTLNARLGILGGISILGTTGIVLPYSTAAFRASVVQGVQVAGTLGHGIVVLTTGGRTEKFVMQEMPELPQAAFVQMGDFLRYAMGAAVKAGLRRVVIGGMVGKLTKIAQGETITHAGRAEVDTALLTSQPAWARPPMCAMRFARMKPPGMPASAWMRSAWARRFTPRWRSG